MKKAGTVAETTVKKAGAERKKIAQKAMLRIEELRGMTRADFEKALQPLKKKDFLPDWLASGVVTYEGLQEVSEHPRVEPEEALIRNALSQMGVDTTGSESLHFIVGLLRDTFGDRISAMDAADRDTKVFCCDKCLEVSTDDFDECPFCGHGGGDLPFQGALKAGKSAPKAAIVPAKPAAPKLAALPTVTPLDKIKTPEQKRVELEASCTRINALKGEIVRNSYDIGAEILRIDVGELWKAEGFESFAACVEQKLDIKRSMAYRLRDIAQKFTREQVAEIGTWKLALIAGVDEPEKREQLTEEAKTKSARQVKELVEEAKGKGKPAVVELLPPVLKDGAAAPPADDRIPVAAKVDKDVQSLNWLHPKTGAPIDEWSDGSYVEVKVGGDVVMRLSLVLDADGRNVGAVAKFDKVQVKK